MRSWLFRLADNRVDGSLAVRMRRARFRLFEELVARLPRPVRILDVGGTESYWLRMGVTPERGYHVTIVNRVRVPVTAPFIVAQLGDATDLSEFADGSFDVAFSNSVIEHVGDRAAQQRMADEVMRIGARYYVQTPNRAFPIEPHFLMPFFPYWPRGLRVALIQRADLGWCRRVPEKAEAEAFIDSFQLLNEREFAALFPQATIHRERVLGAVKSFVAIGAGRQRTDRAEA